MKPNREKTAETAKSVRSDRVVRKQAKTARLPALPNISYLPLDATEESSGDSPNRKEIPTNESPALTIALPALPVVQANPRPIQVAAYRRSQPDSEETALEMAREIMLAAKERVSELLGIASTAKVKNRVSGEVAAAAAYRADKPSPETAAAPAKEWVVIYRLHDAQTMKRITDQLETLSMTPRNREFLDGEYVIEIGTFSDEWRARARVDFLNEITKVAPELRVRMVMRTVHAGQVDAGRFVH